MDLYELETFLAVAQERSFSRAAQRLRRTQPAVSQIVRKLERELGESLFDRSSREGRLTDAGTVLLEYAQRLLNMRAHAEDALRELRQFQRGRITVAANEFTVLYLLRVLDPFRRLHPMISISVHRALARRIPEELLNRSVELGVLAYAPEDPLLRSIVVYRDELAFVVHPSHPLAERHGEMSIRELGAETFIAHNVPSSYRARVIEAFRRHHTPLHMDIELPTLEAIKKFVAMKHGVALVPGLCVENELARRELVRIPVRELRMERKLRLSYVKNATLSHAARAFLKVVKSMAAQGGGFSFKAES
ncbi:MAG: LysR family transcriptional regulator [Acidobacteria bacterium]|nr:LysR family transcriptional regulator [Acidobacteriota bacterium]